MKEIIDTLTNMNVMEFATDPRVLFFAAVLFVIALIRKWTFILLLLFAVAAIIAVIRYTNPTAGEGGVDQQMIIFVGGILAVAVILIYFLFIRGD